MSELAYTAQNQKPQPLTADNGRHMYGYNRYVERVCFVPTRFGDKIYPYLNYVSSSQCQSLSSDKLHFFTVHDQLATKYKGEWFCLTAATIKDLDAHNYQYVTYEPCNIMEIRQRWKYRDKKYWSLANGLSWGEIHWTISQAKKSSDLNTYIPDIVKEQNWIANPTQPVGLTYPANFMWRLLENPLIRNNIASAQPLWNADTGVIFLWAKEQHIFYCLESMRVKTGTSDSVNWKICNPSDKKEEHQWKLEFPAGHANNVRLTDKKGGVLSISNSGFSGYQLGRMYSVASDTSFPWNLQTSWELDSTASEYLSASYKNMMGMLDTGKCPAPGWGKGKTTTKQSRQTGNTRIIPPATQLILWARHLYQILNQPVAEASAHIGGLTGSHIGIMEGILEMTFSSDTPSQHFTPAGYIYSNPSIDTGTPIVERFEAEQGRHNVIEGITGDAEAFVTTTDFMIAQRGLSFVDYRQEASYLMARHLTRLSPIMEVSDILRVTQDIDPLSAVIINNIINNMLETPRGTTFIVQMLTRTSFGNVRDAQQRTYGVINLQGGLHFMASLQYNEQEVTLATFRAILEQPINDWQDFQNMISPDLQIHSIEVFQLDEAPPFPPPPPQGNNMGSGAELSFGNCTESEGTHRSGDGLGGGAARVNLCATANGRCGENININPETGEPRRKKRSLIKLH